MRVLEGGAGGSQHFFLLFAWESHGHGAISFSSGFYRID
jgi:hypothetical protein